ncbi:hypothetical protein G4B88_030119 [Cannabis sativa]|uniref:Long-chain-fatty-acid--CoA ligase n=1 Tax=Cannabis sativa TaxID=3483 RepID=A0A7J6EEJ9_CANSA|nr:hypothetical protein G4B88_030119 [Cannabis sativa]
MSYTVRVEEARPATEKMPSAGPVYRSIYAKDGLLELPEGLHSPWDFFSESVKRNPKSPLLGQRQITDSKAGPYVWLTYQEVHDEAVRMASAMRSRGVNPGDRCGIYGTNCSQWIIAMQACYSHAVTYVPLYDTLGPNAVEFIINHGEVSIAFVQENKIPSILSCLPNCSSYIKTIVSFANVTSLQKKEGEKLGVSCFSWEEFSQLGNLSGELPEKQRTDICTLMYTSGTTGEPKGFSEDDVYFSYLPLAHVYDQIVENYCIYKGSAIGYWRGDIRFLMDDLQELKPTIFCGVPRVYDRIYAGIFHKVSSGGTLKKMLFQYAYNYKLANMEKGLPHDKAAPLMDKIIKQGLGGRIRLMFSGAAPLPHHVEEYLRVTSCASVTQGYGLTESCGGCLTSIANIFPMIGTVGVPITTIEVRLESVPEMGYDALSDKPRGEICLRGTTLFSGYHKREDLTKDVLVDGWFHTGDIGEWQPNGAMKIIDRKKNIFKLSQGEYVAVENIEGIYLQCPLIASIWVYGNSFESFLVAVVVPERLALENWATTRKLTDDFKSLCENPKAIYLEPNPFDMERDLITPTFKLKRPQLLKHYKDCIDKLYNEAKEARLRPFPPMQDLN